MKAVPLFCTYPWKATYSMINKNLKDLHVLIAEDDVDDADIITLSFEKSDFFKQVNLVKNGEQLLSFLNNNRYSLPDVILTNLNMPKKDGYEAMVDIAKDPDFRKIPVFVYSSTINPTYALKCKDLGAKDFLVKPFSLFDFDIIPDQIIKFLTQELN